MTEFNIFDIRDDVQYRSIIIDSTCLGIKNSNNLKDIINYFLDNKLELLNIEIFKDTIYENDDKLLDLMIPCIRRVWSKFFINPPEILTSIQIDLYQLSFDIDQFLDYLIEIIPKVKSSLVHFDELDRTIETLNLIVDNYVAMSIRKCIESQNLKQEIRDFKIKKMIND